MLGHYKGGRGARSRRADASRAPRSRCPRGASTLLADSEEVEGGEEAAAGAKDGVHEVAGDGGKVDAGEGGVEKAVVAEDEPVLVVEEVVLELALEDGGKTVHVIVEERREQLRQGRRRAGSRRAGASRPRPSRGGGTRRGSPGRASSSSSSSCFRVCVVFPCVSFAVRRRALLSVCLSRARDRPFLAFRGTKGLGSAWRDRVQGPQSQQRASPKPTSSRDLDR